MRWTRLPVLAASLFLLSPGSLQIRPALTLALALGGVQEEVSLRLKLLLLLLLGEEPGPAPGPWPFRPGLPDSEHGGTAPLTGPSPRVSPAWELLRRRLAQLSDRLKRHDPPLSIDLTFHLLRQMMEISRAKSQQAQAEKNRLLLDSVGK